jgi:hypothetical protein
MRTDEQTEFLVTRLFAMKHEYWAEYAAAQDRLRAYVTNKDYPLDDRFEVWADWCEKEHHDWLIHEADVPLFGAVVENDDTPSYPDRYVVYSWEDFLEMFQDDVELCEAYKVSIDDVKEMLIKTNFKGYTHDW